MSGRDPRYGPALDRAFRWVERAVTADFGQPSAFTDMLRDRVRALHGVAASDGQVFAPVALPVAISLGSASYAAAACTAFHLAGAVMAGSRAGVEPALSAADLQDLSDANQVLLAAVQTFLGDLDEAAAAMRTAAFAAKRLSGGRTRALAVRRAGEPIGPPEALALARLETGCAYGFYAQVAGIAGGMPTEAWTPLWTWGESIGAARQLEVHSRVLEAADPSTASQLAYQAGLLREEAAKAVAGVWLPWGARPLLEAVAGLPPDLAAAHHPAEGLPATP